MRKNLVDLALIIAAVMLTIVVVFGGTNLMIIGWASMDRVHAAFAQQPPPVKGLPATPAPAKVPTQEPTARVFNTTGLEVCDIFNDPKTGDPQIKLLPDTPASMHTWEQCSYELYRAVRYFDARGRAAQDRIDHAMKDLTPPPPPAPQPLPPDAHTPPMAPEPKKP
jgi:hypothetical protein